MTDLYEEWLLETLAATLEEYNLAKEQISKGVIDPTSFALVAAVRGAYLIAWSNYQNLRKV